MAEEQNQKVIPMPKEREYIALTDDNQQVTGFITHKRQNYLGVNWVAFYQTALEWLATQNLPNQEYRVLMYLMSKLDFENYLRITQVSIADALNIKQSNVSKAIKGLLDRDILITGPQVGTAKTYRLNPRMAYKGKNPKQTIIEYDAFKKAQKKNND
jgi:hypothetical protein